MAFCLAWSTTSEAKWWPSRKGRPYLRIRMSASSCEAVQSLFSSSSARSRLITRAFSTRSRSFSVLMPAATIAVFWSTSFGSDMPGVMLWVWITGPSASVIAVEASLRVELSRPGLRFCGMALDT